jgi:uncharacterized small protein (DUF1192 family)
LIQSTAQVIIDQFAKNLAIELSGAPAPAAPAPVPPAAPAAEQAAAPAAVAAAPTTSTEIAELKQMIAALAQQLARIEAKLNPVQPISGFAVARQVIANWFAGGKS